jgi:methionyl aminopeptidase
VPVGEVDPSRLELLRVTEESLWHGIAAARLGGRLTDISHAIETYIRSQEHPGGGDWGIVEEYVGHGIGTEMHQDPQVYNYAPKGPGRGPKLEKGLALAVEPMVNLGSRLTQVLDDGWTVVTQDGAPSAHFEHTFTLTEEGPWVLTAIDGGAAKLAELAAASEPAAS